MANIKFGDVFAEYYALFRGRGTNLPVFGDREYTLGIFLYNNAVKKWDRADGQLWRELVATLQVEQDGDLTVSSGTLDYAAPANMRKPPKKVRFTNTSNSSYHEVDVSSPVEALDFASNSTFVWFEGGANTGYTMHISSNIATAYTGFSINYVYIKKPRLLTISTTQTPANVVPEMSDPNFAIQDMVASRAAQARNGFLYKTAKSDSSIALQNMKIEDISGTFGGSDNLGSSGAGFGTAGSSRDIAL